MIQEAATNGIKTTMETILVGTLMRLERNSIVMILLIQGILSRKLIRCFIYMDKNVTVCDLPEIVVCYKEKTYHVVKDICADEGVLVQEKSVTCNSNSNSNLCESEDLVKSNALETESFENRKGKLD